MLLDDGVGDRQAEAGALADLLRREERIEDLALHLSRNPGSIVTDLKHDGLVFDVVPRADDQRAAAVGREHRLFGIDDEVEQHLLNLMRVGKDGRQS